ncbi:aldo/keto reductase [Rhodoferax sp. GW822-FHT02A01]|uniref:aldo/keto reductase n=1 Tax=Rhodoferax sp. GW822-FHT02A01 TaxID=3141537 RepID=UPI00315C4C4E
MQKRALGSFQVGRIGLGCMNLDHAYGPAVSEEEGERALLGALDAGYTLMDTATLYGAGMNEERVGRVLRNRRNDYVLSSKCGMEITKVDGKPVRVIDGSPETLMRQIEASLRRLGVDVIDLYYLHRWDRKVPIEDSVGALARMVEKGYVRSIGLSEVSAVTLRRAHAVHPITALQTEYSLWSRNAEIAALDACRELGVAFVAFSPVARGYLCDRLHDVTALYAKDIRRSMPRFEPATYAKNLELLTPYRQLAEQVGCTPSQLALAWLLHKAPHIIPIPGSQKLDHILENAAADNVVLSADVMQQLEGLINNSTVHGPRYDPQATGEVDTEQFA